MLKLNLKQLGDISGGNSNAAFDFEAMDSITSYQKELLDIFSFLSTSNNAKKVLNGANVRPDGSISLQDKILVNYKVNFELLTFEFDAFRVDYNGAELVMSDDLNQHVTNAKSWNHAVLKNAEFCTPIRSLAVKEFKSRFTLGHIIDETRFGNLAEFKRFELSKSSVKNYDTAGLPEDLSWEDLLGLLDYKEFREEFPMTVDAIRERTAEIRVFKIKRQDCFGDMFVIKLFLVDTLKYVCLPIVNLFYGNNPNRSELRMVSLESSVLSHGEELGDGEHIILADDPSIGDANCAKTAGFKWVSTIPGLEVDFKKYSFLHKAKEIYIFVTNHSGRSLLDAIDNALNIAKQLLDSCNITPSFLIARTIYPSLSLCNSTDGEFKNGAIDTNTFAHLSMPELELLKEDVHAELENAKFLQYYSDVVGSNQLSKLSTQKNNDQSGEFLIYPYLRRGSNLLVAGDPGIGKTPLVYQIAAKFVAGQNIFKGSFRFSIPRSIKEHDRKVLCLCYEANSEAEIEMQRKSIVRPILKKTPKLVDNVIIEPVFSKIDQPESVKKTVDMVKKSGADIVIIDTFMAAIGGAYTDAGMKHFMSLTKELNKSGVAVIVVDHCNGRGAVAGGWKKMCDPATVLILEGERDRELGDPKKVRIEKSRHARTNPEKESFEIKFENGSFDIHGSALTKAGEARKIRDAHLQCGLSVDELIKNSGMGKSSYYAFLKKE